MVGENFKPKKPWDMVHRPTAPLRLFLRLFFDPTDLSEVDADKIRAAAGKGTVVYVVSHSHFFAFLFLYWAFLHYRLPLMRFVNAVSLWLLWPFKALWALIRGRHRIPMKTRLAGTVRQGNASMIFLRSGRALRRGWDRVIGDELIAELLSVQKELDKPLIFVPLTVVWGQHPVRPPPQASPMVRVFGHQEAPGRLRSLFQLFKALGRLRILAADPVSISDLLSVKQGDSEQGDSVRAHVQSQVEAIRGHLEEIFEADRRAILGPPRKGARRIRQELLQSPRMKEAIEALAAEQAVASWRLFKRADKYLKEIGADIGNLTLRFMRWLMGVTIPRIYSGIEIDDEYMQKLRDAARLGPILIMPSHKSHVDYLFMSWFLASRGIAPPLICAGVNLSFWPVGPIFRRSGAFFMRRSFKDDRLYTLVFTEYLAKVLAEGYNVEFFIEGGRSRTGKVLLPRMGLLKWIVEHSLNGRVPGVQVAPINITYEKVIEAPSYARELAGGQKGAEGVGDLVSAGRVLGGRYGRLIFQTDQPFSLEQAIAETGVQPGASEEAVNAAINRIAKRIAYAIAHQSAVTPTALLASALLCTGKRNLPRSFVLQAIRFFGQRTLANKARFSKSLLPPRIPQASPPFSSSPPPSSSFFSVEAIDRAVDFFSEDLLISVRHEADETYYYVNDDSRPILAYYRNGIINYLIAESLLATALLAIQRKAGPDGRIGLGDLRRRTLELSRLLKKEFIYRVGATFDVIFQQTLSAMTGWGVEVALESEADGDEPCVRTARSGTTHIELLSGLARDFVTAYRSAAEGLVLLLSGPMGQRGLERHLHEHSLRSFYTGNVSRREACIKPLFSTAVELWLDTGVLQPWPGRSRSGPPLTLSPEYASKEQILKLADSVRFFES